MHSITSIPLQCFPLRFCIHCDGEINQCCFFLSSFLVSLPSLSTTACVMSSLFSLFAYGVIQDSLQVQFKASSTQAKAIFYPPFYLAAFLRFMRFLRRKSIGPFLSPTLEPGFKKVCFRPPKKPDLSGRSARQRLTCSLEILASSTTCHRQYFPL